MSTEQFRVETDTMGQVRIPASAYYGAQTQRAVENFTISDKRIPTAMIRALGHIKRAAAVVNADLGELDRKIAEAIIQASDEVIAGTWDEHFPIDVFQTGSGTSWNMNINEVLSNRSIEILGGEIGSKKPVHPNDHVNRGQSSNDVIPTAVHVADRMVLGELLAAVQKLSTSFDRKAEEFKDVVKLGRTHLKDAVPMTLGQEFATFALQIRKAHDRIQRTAASLEELPLGGTAVGTGLNAHPDYRPAVVAEIARATGLPFRPSPLPFEGISSRDAQVELMGAINGLAVALMKIANDLRLLDSGPRSALGEIALPSLQPGSSIMPGKVNPVIPEMMIQVAAHVQGQVLSVSIGAQNGPLQLNMMNPLIAYETVDAMKTLAATCTAAAERCVDGITADAERCEHWIEWSTAMVTPLARTIGYDRASELAYKAFKEKRTIRDVCLEAQVVSEAELNDILNPRNMV
ncbi:MAG: class II fumarate hydratase [Spirochaetaceae bacterium]|nr:MAG: class II fumarate hydratase [Spirochaetaceae bacterium]